MEHRIIHADSLDWMTDQLPDSVDLVFTSPPYEDARYYDELKFKLKEGAWVSWLVPFCVEAARISKGLCAFVVQGKTRNFEWSAVPARLMVRLRKKGLILRNPPIFHRHCGIAGSGGKDWLRSDYDWIVCFQGQRGRLPWSDNTACGHPPKWAPGGEMSHRISDGTRRNQWGKHAGGALRSRKPDGTRDTKVRPSHRVTTKAHTKRMADGSMADQVYVPPAIANPGNVISGNVGKGHMGHDLAHENEAPFPLWLAEFFVKSFCPPEGVVLDPFGGSGTVLHAAENHGRSSISIDLRESQCEIMRRRLQEISDVGPV